MYVIEANSTLGKVQVIPTMSNLGNDGQEPSLILLITSVPKDKRSFEPNIVNGCKVEIDTVFFRDGEGLVRWYRISGQQAKTPECGVTNKPVTKEMRETILAGLQGLAEELFEKEEEIRVELKKHALLARIESMKGQIRATHQHIELLESQIDEAQKELLTLS